MHGVCAQGRTPEHIAVQSARIEPKGRNRAPKARIEPKGRNRAPKARIAAGNRALKKTPKRAIALNREQGSGMSVVERQIHIKTETQDFNIYLVFNHFILKCFVLIDLKTGVLKHKDIGQMYMCVRIFHDIGKADDDTPTVGIANSNSCCPPKMN